MLWPLLVEYTEPGLPLVTHTQQQGNLALFLTLFILTCVEVLIVKVAQSEREIESLLTPHDPPFSTDADDEDDEDDHCKLRLSLEEEALKGKRDDKFFGETLCTKCRPHNGTLSNGSAGSEQCCGNSTCNGSICSGSLKRRGLRRISENWSEEKDVDTPDEDSNDAKTVRIREKIEKLVEEMVGGSLDGVSVGKLCKNSRYLAMFAKHHEPLCQALANLGYALHISLLNKNGFDFDSSRVAHATLKAVVEKVVAEAVKLPDIGGILQNSTEEVGDKNIANKSYEDILATAILNKVIEQCQKRDGTLSSRKHKRTSMRSMRNRNNNIINNEYHEEDVMYNSDWSDTSRSEQLSLTIEEHIEEITTTYENSEEEEEEEFNEEINFNGAIPFPESGRIILNGGRGNSEDEVDIHSSATELITTGNSWEENWLFQKKKLRSATKSHHPVPVPMLVPNPSQDFRALIGGVDADDLSDMSECDDSVLEDVVLAADDEDHWRSEEVKEDAGRSSTNENDTRNEIIETTEVHENVIDTVGSPMSLNSESSFPSLSQKERDVSVDYEYFRKLEIELRDLPLPLQRNSDMPSPETEEWNPPVKCQIAEREKEKWNHAVPLADNPYSAENILKREQRKKMEFFRTGYRNEEAVEFPGDSPHGIIKEPAYEMYSRDYYIKASRCPTGDLNQRSTPETEESFEEGLSKEEEKSVDGNAPEEDIDEGNEPHSRTVQRKVINYWQDGAFRNHIAETTHIVLPSVKELTKKFARGIEEFSPKPSPTPSVSNQGYFSGFSELKKERESSIRNLTTAKEAECNDSKSSVVMKGNIFPSNSVTSRSNVSTAADQEVQTNESSFAPYKTESCNNVKTADKVEEEEVVERKRKPEGEESKEAIKVSSSVTFAKSPGKEVHSLTARSISKEFREELKNNSSRRSLPKVDRGSSGESDHVEVVSESMRNRSPTPPIDLRSKRKFWEDIISNSQK